MKYLITSAFLIICCVSIGIMSNMSSFINSVELIAKYTDGAREFLDDKLTTILSLFGISNSVPAVYDSAFYVRSIADNEVVPKDSPYYHTLYYAVKFDDECFLTIMFNSHNFGKTKDKYVTGLTLYFDTQGDFLFGHDFEGKYNPLNKESEITLTEWEALFAGSYIDIEELTLYLKTTMNSDITYRFASGGDYTVGIWR